MLKECKIDTSYTIEDVISNKDDILTEVLKNQNAAEYIIQDSEELKDKMCNSETAIIELAKNENAKKQIINNKDWLKAIQNSEYANKFDEYSSTIQKMTSNEGPGGTVTAVSTQDDSVPYYAFDKDEETGWVQTYIAVPENELIYTYTDAKLIYRIQAIVQNVTNGATNNSLVISISSTETEDDWKEIYNESWYWGKNSHTIRNNVNVFLEEVQIVKRIKIKSICMGNYWTSWIKEVNAYGI